VDGHSFQIRYELTQGNGSIVRENNYYDPPDIFIMNADGTIDFTWRLGCNNTIQKVRILLYVDSVQYESAFSKYYSQPSDSLVITANATKPDGWIRSCGCSEIDHFYSKIISHDENTLYLVNRGLYSSADGGLNWVKVDGIPYWEDIVDAQFNSLGWLYVVTRSYGICYSKDMKNWQFINNGIIDYRDPTAFLVEDSTLIVSFYFDGPYKTNNNGAFWRKMYVDHDAQRFYNFARHPNGDIYFIDDWADLWISKNYGKSWNRVDIEYKYISSINYELKISNSGLIYLGGDNATISEISPVTYQGEMHSYYVWNGSSQSINNIVFRNDDVLYLVNYTPDPGIYSKQNNWNKLDIDFSGTIRSFYPKSDNTFLIGSEGGLYFHE
jgi:hypothetical protein